MQEGGALATASDLEVVSVLLLTHFWECDSMAIADHNAIIPSL